MAFAFGKGIGIVNVRTVSTSCVDRRDRIDMIDTLCAGERGRGVIIGREVDWMLAYSECLFKVVEFRYGGWMAGRLCGSGLYKKAQ